MDTRTIRTWNAACSEGGWRTFCQTSPLPKGTPSVAIELGPNWAPAGRDRIPAEGYEYGLACTCESPGFKGKSDKQYWSRWKRKLNR
jgi:hypothetical protein